MRAYSRLPKVPADDRSAHSPPMAMEINTLVSDSRGAHRRQSLPPPPGGPQWQSPPWCTPAGRVAQHHGQREINSAANGALAYQVFFFPFLAFLPSPVSCNGAGTYDSMKSTVLYLRKKASVKQGAHSLRRSITRLALPSLRSMDLGSKRVILGDVQGGMEGIRQWCAPPLQALRTVSENMLSFISTCTSRVSRLFFGPRSCGSGVMPKSSSTYLDLGGEHVDAPDDEHVIGAPWAWSSTVQRPQAHFMGEGPVVGCGSG